MAEVKGSCMCGAVEFTAVPVHAQMHACHCDMCRKWSGGVYLGVDCGNSVKIKDGAPLKFFTSSEWGERGFCADCGSSLFWRLRDSLKTFAALSALENASDYAFATELYIDAKPHTYNFAEPTQKLTRAEVIALFTQQED